MKKRRNVFIAFVVIALLFMGIGYAALTDTAKIVTTVKGNAEGSVVNKELFDLGLFKGSIHMSSNDDDRILGSGDENVVNTYVWDGESTAEIAGSTTKIYDSLSFTIKKTSII